MIMYTINHYGTKIGNNYYALIFFDTTETVGHPYFLEVAHEQTVIVKSRIAKPASNLFFIIKRIFRLTVKRGYYFIKIT